MLRKLSKHFTVILLAVVLMMGVLSSSPASLSADEPFKFGIEVLLESKKDLLEGKRVGLVTNPTGVDQQLNSIVDILFEDPDINLTALYGPEHGVRGNAPAGSYIEFYTDPVTGLPVYSLYGSTRKPTPEMLENVDVILFDIQDAGVTFYTYIWSMYYVMESAAENNKEVIILDRPNPLGGNYVGGPVEIDPGQSSFVGLMDLAVVHGMTFGEIAQYFKGEFGLDVELNVITMNNYDANKRYDELGIPFVMPSPNMPTTDTVDVYPITGFFESFSNVSEGRGTTKPFQLIGATFIDSTSYARELNALNLPGVRFRAAAFTPLPGQKLAGELVQGVEVYVTDTDAYDPIRTGLYMIQTIEKLYPGELAWRADGWMAKLSGKTYIEEDLKAGVAVDEIIAKWQDELEAFKEKRENYLLYSRNGEPVDPIISYTIAADDFELSFAEAQNITDELLIEKAQASALSSTDETAIVTVLEHTIEKTAGEYTVTFAVLEDPSVQTVVAVRVLEDDTDPVDPENPETEEPQTPDEKETGQLPNTGIQTMGMGLAGLIFVLSGTSIFLSKRNKD